MPNLVLLLAPLLWASRPAPRVATDVGPIRSLCMPPDSDVTGTRRQLGEVSFTAPQNFSLLRSETDIQMYMDGSRYFEVTTFGNRMFTSASDILNRVTCHTSINGRGVTILSATTELEQSKPFTPPGVIGTQHIAVAEWDQPVSGREVLALIIARSPDDLERFKGAFYSIRIAGDSATVADAPPMWTSLATDTIGGLRLETQGFAGRVRFIARGMKGDAFVATPDIAADSVLAWTDAIEQLRTAPSTTVHPLGTSIAAAGVAVGGVPAVAVSFGEETSDQAITVAMAPADAARLVRAIRAAIPGHPARTP